VLHPCDGSSRLIQPAEIVSSQQSRHIIPGETGSKGASNLRQNAAEAKLRGSFEAQTSPVIFPSGDFLTGLSIPLCKNISLNPSGKSSLQARAIPPHRGALAIVTNAGRDAVDAAASGA
jgi:hypothetical protein